jgi:hypothetical protein
MAKNRASAKRLPFDLDRAFLIELWDQNEGRCVLTKRPFDLSAYGGKGQANPNSPSIDRIEPELGYVKGNVRLIIYHLNIALSGFGTEEFTKLAKDYLDA